MSDALVPVMADAFQIAWPGSERDPTPIEYLPFSRALRGMWITDAHFAAYSVPSITHRLMTDALDRLPGVPMVLFIADIDDAVAHASGIDARVEWLRAERAKVDRLFAVHPGGYAYVTRGGYRLAYSLATPHVIRSRTDAADWKREYFERIAYLLGGFDIVADPNCADWPRLYRLPRVVRDAERGLEPRRGSVGNPSGIAALDARYEPARDLAAVRRLIAATRGENGRSVWDRVINALDPPPYVPPAAIVIATPHDASRERRYSDAALRSACQVVAGAAPQSRNVTLRAQAYSIGRLVASGVLSEGAAADALENAALSAGPGLGKIRRTIASAFQSASRSPRRAPEMTLDRLEGAARERPGVAFSREVLSAAAVASGRDLAAMVAAVERAGINPGKWAACVRRHARMGAS